MQNQDKSLNDDIKMQSQQRFSLYLPYKLLRNLINVNIDLVTLEIIELNKDRCCCSLTVQFLYWFQISVASLLTSSHICHNQKPSFFSLLLLTWQHQESLMKKIL